MMMMMMTMMMMLKFTNDDSNEDLDDHHVQNGVPISVLSSSSSLLFLNIEYIAYIYDKCPEQW